MRLSIDKLIQDKVKECERIKGPSDYLDDTAIFELMQSYAESELKRYAQYMKDQGFCPDQAYCGHIDDCMASFTKEGQK